MKPTLGPIAKAHRGFRPQSGVPASQVSEASIGCPVYCHPIREKMCYPFSYTPQGPGEDTCDSSEPLN